MPVERSRRPETSLVSTPTCPSRLSTNPSISLISENKILFVLLDALHGVDLLLVQGTVAQMPDSISLSANP